MSVINTIIVDDRHYVCGEPHGSCAEWIFAACSCNPKSLEELNALLPEFGTDENLHEFFGGSPSSFDLKPVDAGLIIVDLAKKWIYAQDSYFGAHRRGGYRLGDDDEKKISYEFSGEWQFVSEPKWFRYLHGCKLSNYFYDQTENDADVIPKENSKAEDDDSSMFDDLEFLRENRRPAMDFMLEKFDDDKGEFEYDPRDNDEEDDDDEWDAGIHDIMMAFSDRSYILSDFESETPEEKRDLQILEHLLEYEEKEETSRQRIENAREKIGGFQILLQAAESLWQNTKAPRWGLKRIRWEAHIDRQEKRISRFSEEHAEAAEMASELRGMGATEKFHQFLQKWEDESKDDGDDSHSSYDFPF